MDDTPDVSLDGCSKDVIYSPTDLQETIYPLEPVQATDELIGKVLHSSSHQADSHSSLVDIKKSCLNAGHTGVSHNAMDGDQQTALPHTSDTAAPSASRKEHETVADAGDTLQVMTSEDMWPHDTPINISCMSQSWTETKAVMQSHQSTVRENNKEDIRQQTELQEPVQVQFNGSTQQDQGQLLEPSLPEQGQMIEPTRQVEGELTEPTRQVEGELTEPTRQVEGELTEPTRQVEGELTEPTLLEQGQLIEPTQQRQGELSESTQQEHGHLPVGSIPLTALNVLDQVQCYPRAEGPCRCSVCGQVFEEVLAFVIHQCRAAQLSEVDTAPTVSTQLPNPNMQLFECTKCRLLFNQITELKDHKCLGYLNEPEREERRKRRMVTVGGERVAAHKAKRRLQKIACSLDDTNDSQRGRIRLKIKLSLPRGRPPSHNKLSLPKARAPIQTETLLKRGPGRPRKHPNARLRRGRPPKLKEVHVSRGRPQKQTDELLSRDRQHKFSETNGAVSGPPESGLEDQLHNNLEVKEEKTENIQKDEHKLYIGQNTVSAMSAPKRRGRPPKNRGPVKLKFIKQEPSSEYSFNNFSLSSDGHQHSVDSGEKSALGDISDKDMASDHDVGDDDELKDETYMPSPGQMESATKEESSGPRRADTNKSLKKRQARDPSKPRRPQEPPDPNNPTVKRRVPQKKTDPADLVCKYCGKKCRKPYELRVHERLHTNEKPFSCSKCSKAYVSNSLLNKHIRDAHLGANLRCKECDKSYGSKEELKAHCDQFSHSIQWPFPCDKCDKSYPKRKLLENHLLIHQGIKPFTCSVCNVGFNTRISLLQHMRTHTGDRPFECEVCGHRFLTRHLLNAHKMNHTGERPHLCDVCGKGFKLAAQLRHHSEVHRKEKPYMCDTCGKKFKWRYNMLNHAKTHTQQDAPKPLRYFCSVCGKGYFHKSGMEYHERTHTGERPYVCRRCGKKFRHNAHLQKHLNRVHHLTMDLKPLDPSELPERKPTQRTGSSTKPFPCSFCSKEFRQKVGLDKHMRIFHRLTPEGLSVCSEIEPQLQGGQPMNGLLQETGLQGVVEGGRALAPGPDLVLDGPYHTTSSSSSGLRHHSQPFPLDISMASNPLLSPPRSGEVRGSLMYSSDYMNAATLGMPPTLMNLPSGFMPPGYNVRTLTEDETSAL